MYRVLLRLAGRRAAAVLTALWYVALVVAVVYFAPLDQAAFRYGQL